MKYMISDILCKISYMNKISHIANKMSKIIDSLYAI